MNRTCFLNTLMWVDDLSGCKVGINFNNGYGWIVYYRIIAIYCIGHLAEEIIRSHLTAMNQFNPHNWGENGGWMWIMLGFFFWEKKKRCERGNFKILNIGRNYLRISRFWGIRYDVDPVILVPTFPIFSLYTINISNIANMIHSMWPILSTINYRIEY